MFRKTRSLIAAFLVVIVQIVPGPMGLRPAHAAIPLAVVAVGAVIAATGVMVAGAGVYKPPTFAQANAAVDSVTGDITRKVQVARAFGTGASAGLRGFESSYTLDFQKAYDWIKTHTPDFPLLGPAATSATLETPRSPFIGLTYTRPAGGIRKILTMSSPLTSWNMATSEANAKLLQAQLTVVSLGGGCGKMDDVLGGNVYYGFSIAFNAAWGAQPWRLNWSRYYVTEQDMPAGTPLTPPVTSLSPSAFAAAYPNTVGGQDETDKIAADNPSAIKTPPAAITPEQAGEAAKQAAAVSATDTATTAEARAAADPTNTALQIAAQQAREAANQATIDAQSDAAKLETEKPEEIAPPVPAAPLAPAVPLVPEVVPLEFLPPIKEAMDGLSASLTTHEPFASFSTIPTLLGALTAPPVAPVIDLEFFGTHHIDLSPWNGAATMLRAGLSLFALIGATIFAIKIWV